MRRVEVGQVPFSPTTKANMFISCGRLCCLCLKQCGTNIEAAHIIAEADGGSNDFENGIPVCFDCHADSGHYNPRHPKGNKFSEMALKARRDRVYALVESGVIDAVRVAERARVGSSESYVEVPAAPSAKPQMSSEARDLLEHALADDSALMGFGRKLGLLSEADRAAVIDALIVACRNDAAAIGALAALLHSGALDATSAPLALERAVRTVTLAAAIDLKAALLRQFDSSMITTVDEPIRLALFDELIEIMARDQFDEVNVIVPLLVGHHEAVPADLQGKYVKGLIKQAGSHSYQGSAAARRALTRLPNDVARRALEELDAEFLVWHLEQATPFVTEYINSASPPNDAMLRDVLDLSRREFRQKYDTEDDF